MVLFCVCVLCCGGRMLTLQYDDQLPSRYLLTGSLAEGGKMNPSSASESFPSWSSRRGDACSPRRNSLAARCFFLGS
jgi:hypothetical protein